MLVSRTLARKNIAAGVRPTWLGAWGPVIADAVLFFGIAGFSAPFIVGGLADEKGAWVYVALFAIYFIPMQLVLITSAMWAARSRWSEDE